MSAQPLRFTKLLTSKHTLAFWIGIFVTCICTGEAMAQTVTNNRLDEIVNLYRTHSSQWSGAISDFALRLFGLLAIIEFSWSAISLAFKGADFSEWLAELVNRIMFIGFFLTLLLHSGDWARAIVQSFRTAADAATMAGGGTAGISPSNIFDTALEISGNILDKVSAYHPGDSIGLFLGAFIIIICYALIAAFMILALVESYIVISAGVLLMGFGGSRWTKDYAIKTITYAVSVGAKLFVMQLLVGLGQTIIQSWLANFGSSMTDILVMIGAAVVMLALTKSVPDIIQGLINGTSVGHGGALVGTAAAVGAAAAGVAATVATGGSGAVAAGAAAFKLAREQLATNDSDKSGAGYFAAIAGKTVKNLAGETAADIGRRLSGRSHHGHVGWSAAGAMKDKAQALRLEREKPTDPQQSQPNEPNQTSQTSNLIRPRKD